MIQFWNYLNVFFAFNPNNFCSHAFHRDYRKRPGLRSFSYGRKRNMTQIARGYLSCVQRDGLKQETAQITSLVTVIGTRNLSHDPCRGKANKPKKKIARTRLFMSNNSKSTQLYSQSWKKSPLTLTKRVLLGSMLYWSLALTHVHNSPITCIIIQISSRSSVLNRRITDRMIFERGIVP